jgi:Zn-dependent protease with chaperone function
MLADLEQGRLQTLQGTCGQAVRHGAFTISRTVDVRALVETLRPLGVSELTVVANASDVPHVAFSGLPTPTAAKAIVASYTINLQQASTVPILKVDYGYARRDLLTIAALVGLFFSIPIVLMLRMRSVALSTHETDPVGAWFAFMKTLGWTCNAEMLVWYVTTVFGRDKLEKLIDFLISAGPLMSVAVNVGTLLLPPMIVYLACLAISHPVFVAIKRSTITWGEFLLTHWLQIARTLIPFAFFIGGLRLIGLQPKIATALMLSAYFMFYVLVRWMIRLGNNIPQAISTGELRDSVFALAKKAGVKLEQVLIIPAERMQVANAFASKNSRVMFTDYLVQRMNKRELDAIAAHEVTHLQHGHPQKLGMMLIAVYILPGFLAQLMGASPRLAISLLAHLGFKVSVVASTKVYVWIRLMQEWGITSLVFILIGFAAFYALSRRFERVADRGSAKLSGDPEAAVTALLKLNYLNFTPLNWGKGTAAALTHPSTLKRVEKIAADAGLPHAKLSELIARFSAQNTSREALDNLVQANSPVERYAIPAEVVSGKSAAKNFGATQNALWTLLALHILPAALFLAAVQRMHVTGTTRSWVLVAGVVVTIAIYFLAQKLLPIRHLGKVKLRHLSDLKAQGLDLEGLDRQMVGFSPGHGPRMFAGGYTWDTGFVLLGRDKMAYVGGKLKFAINRQQVLNIRLGDGVPSWWPQQRIYVRWRDEADGTEREFAFGAADSGSLRQLNAGPRALYLKLLNWRVRGAEQKLPPLLESFTAPAFGEVTSKPLRSTLAFKNQLGVLLLVFAGIFVTSQLLEFRSAGYLYLTALVVRLFEIAPFLRYREAKAESSRLVAQQAKAATAGA